MSEHAPHTPHEDEPQAAEPAERLQKHEADKPREKKAESKTEPALSAEKIRDSVEREAISSEKQKHKLEDEDENQSPQLPIANKEVRKHARDQTLREVRRQLSAPQRQFSKFIHNPAIEQVSETASGTIARPSGLLIGGVCSFLSSIGLLIICNYYGYTYNFLVALVFFGGGFVIGLAGEALLRAFRR